MHTMVKGFRIIPFLFMSFRYVSFIEHFLCLLEFVDIIFFMKIYRVRKVDIYWTIFAVSSRKPLFSKISIKEIALCSEVLVIIVES